MSRVRLIGDGIENPKNARAILDAAGLFGAACFFRDAGGLTEQWNRELGGTPLPLIEMAALVAEAGPIVAVENAPGSRPVFGAAPLDGNSALVVGNERRGIAESILRSAHRTFHIPMAGRGPNTLNVAAASAVALYYLTSRRGGPVRSARPEHRRPAVLISCPRDHVEAGSAIRSAAAFGWRSVCVDDRHGVWFGTPRSTRTEGRAAARSHRGGIRVVRVGATDRLGYQDVTVIGLHLDAPPLHRVGLATGPRSLLVLPDESGLLAGREDWSRFGQRVRFARIDVPHRDSRYRYRLPASIALAEAARQVGARPRELPTRPPSRRLSYESALATSSLQAAEFLTWDELRAY